MVLGVSGLSDLQGARGSLGAPGVNGLGFTVWNLVRRALNFRGFVGVELFGAELHRYRIHRMLQKGQHG